MTSAAPLRIKTIWGLALCLAGFAVAGCGTAPTPAPRISLAALPAEQQARAQKNTRVFERVWSLVADKHYDAKLSGVDWPAAGLQHGPAAAAAKDDQELYAALNKMLAPLGDSHTAAWSPREVRERKTQRGLRVGVAFHRVEGRIVVYAVHPGSPAEQTGVKAGWILVAVDGEPVGPNGPSRTPTENEPVECEFLDETDQPVKRTLRQQWISVAPQEVARMLPGGYLYLRFDQFEGKSARWLSSQLEKHASVPGVVIDLRQNYGGRSLWAVLAIGEFFEKAVPTGTSIERDGSTLASNSLQLGSAKYRGKVAVLTSGASASCAEVFAVVLQEHARATIVGRKTAGALLSSWFYSLPDGGELQLSVSDYVSPKGRRIEGAGVIPDVAVPTTFDSIAGLRAGRDLDVEAALAVLRAEKAVATAGVAAGS